MRILLADDDNKIHVIVKLWLQRNGHTVESAYNGQEALDRLQAESFDGLISDVNMPLMRGVDLVKEVLRQEMPLEMIIMLTSRCDVEALTSEIDSPKVHLFNKPFSPAELTKLIEELSTQKSNAS